MRLKLGLLVRGLSVIFKEAMKPMHLVSFGAEQAGSDFPLLPSSQRGKDQDGGNVKS